MKEIRQKLLQMKIHETMDLEEGDRLTVITRVATGWIYERREPQVNLLNQVFVPDNNDLLDATEKLTLLDRTYLNYPKDISIDIPTF